MYNKFIRYDFFIERGEFIMNYGVVYDHHINDHYTFGKVYRQKFDSTLHRIEGEEQELIDDFEIRDSNEEELTEDYARSYLSKLLASIGR